MIIILFPLQILYVVPTLSPTVRKYEWILFIFKKGSYCIGEHYFGTVKMILKNTLALKDG